VARFNRKRSDKRWIAEDGSVWASKLEWIVYEALRKDNRIHVRRCIKGGSDTFDYVSKVRSGECSACGSGEIIQRRTFTPDLHIVPARRAYDGPGYYLEVKGYFPGPKRKLLGDFLKTGPGIDLRLLLQRDGKATPKLTQLEYVHSRLKIPVHVWDGVLPKDWYIK
jgi:ribosomal protein L37E